MARHRSDQKRIWTVLGLQLAAIAAVFEGPLRPFGLVVLVGWGVQGACRVLWGIEAIIEAQDWADDGLPFPREAIERQEGKVRRANEASREASEAYEERFPPQPGGIRLDESNTDEFNGLNGRCAMTMKDAEMEVGFLDRMVQENAQVSAGLALRSSAFSRIMAWRHDKTMFDVLARRASERGPSTD